MNLGAAACLTTRAAGPKARRRCAFCGRPGAAHPRLAFCGRCQKLPLVRDTIEWVTLLRTRFARQFAYPVPPRRPTAAPLGSEERLRVLGRRFARRQELFHPDDNPDVARPARAASGNRGSVYIYHRQVRTLGRWVAEVVRGGVRHRRGPYAHRRDAEAALRELLAELDGG